MRRRVFIRTAAGLSVVFVLAALGLAWQMRRAGEQAVEQAVAEGRAGAALVAEALDASVRDIPGRVDALRDELERGALQPADVPARLAATLAAGDLASGYGVAFGPGVVEGQPLYAPYFERAPTPGSPPLDIDLALLYDYPEFEYGWYGDTVLDGDGWSEANIFPDVGDQVAMYSVPFTLPGADGFASGVVFATVSLQTVAQVVGNLGPAGYAFLISPRGQYLAHPRDELVYERATLFTTAWETGNEALHRLAVQAMRGEAAFVESQSEIDGRVAWIFAEPVAGTGWSVFLVLFGDQFAPDTDWERRQAFLIILAGFAGVLLGAWALAARSILPTKALLWACSISFTLLGAVGVAAMWFVADRFPPALPQQREVVLDEGTAHQYLLDTGIDASVLFVPTGVFVRSIRIESGAEVAVSGYVWQRFEIGRQDSVPRGFMLPETFDPERSQITEIFNEQIDGEQHIGWEFQAAFRQRFDYGKFPFDHQGVWVRLRPAALANDVVLVPDYGGYALMDPTVRPGVDETIVVPGWDVVSSYFDYRLHAFNASLGIPGTDQQAYPELFFNVELRRRFVSSFVVYIVPLAVTAAMLFALLLISSRREASQGLLGFSAVEIVLGAAALFFVASFQHTALREALLADTLIYFDFFYFGLYLLIMLVSVNAILFASSLDVKLIELHDNLVPKLTFWPLCVGSVLALTLVRFY